MTARPNSNSPYLPFAALLVLAFLWGYNWVVMKVALRYSDPFTFAAVRSFLAAVVLFGLAAARRGTLSPKPFWWTVLASIFQTGFMGFTLWALHLGGVGRISVLVYTMPFWLLLMAWPVLGERVRGLQWAAVALALAGLVLILGPWGLGGLAASLLAVGAGLSWALSSVVFKIIRRHHELSLLTFSAWQHLIGTLPLMIVALIVDHSGPTWNASFIAALVYNVIPASMIAYVLWLYVLNTLPVATAGISSLAIPVVGFSAAWLQLGERPAAYEAVGMGLILAALAVLTARGLHENRRERSAAAPRQALDHSSE